MEVIIEQVLFDNFIIDYIILKLTNKILRLEVVNKRLFLGSLIGCLFALVLPLLSINGILLFLVKIIIGFCMVLVLKKYKSFSEMIVSIITMISITFLFGGLCYAVTCELESKVTMQGFMLGSFEIPIGIILFVIVGYVWIFNKILNYIKIKSQVSNYSYDIEIKLNNKIFNLKGFLDSGNRLYDLDNKPIMLISKSAFESINKKFGELDNILKNVHFVEMQTAAGNNQVLVFEIEQLIIKKENNENLTSEAVRVGIANTNFKNFDCLLGLDMFSVN